MNPALVPFVPYPARLRFRAIHARDVALVVVEASVRPVVGPFTAEPELGWAPTYGAHEALDEFLIGLRRGASGPTPPLAAASGGPVRSHELATAVGGRE